MHYFSMTATGFLICESVNMIYIQKLKVTPGQIPPTIYCLPSDFFTYILMSKGHLLYIDRKFIYILFLSHCTCLMCYFILYIVAM